MEPHLTDCDELHADDEPCNSNAYTVEHDGTPAPEPEPEPTPEVTLARYRVVGAHRLDEVAPGGTVDLDPDESRTARLLARGQIVPCEPTQQED